MPAKEQKAQAQEESAEATDTSSEESAEATGTSSEESAEATGPTVPIIQDGDPAAKWRRVMRRRVEALELTVRFLQKRQISLVNCMNRQSHLEGAPLKKPHPLTGQPVGGGFQEFKIDWKERHKLDLLGAGQAQINKQASMAWKQLNAGSKAVFVEKFNEKKRQWHHSHSQQRPAVASTPPC